MHREDSCDEREWVGRLCDALFDLLRTEDSSVGTYALASVAGAWAVASTPWEAGPPDSRSGSAAGGVLEILAPDLDDEPPLASPAPTPGRGGRRPGAGRPKRRVGHRSPAPKPPRPVTPVATTAAGSLLPAFSGTTPPVGHGW